MILRPATTRFKIFFLIIIILINFNYILHAKEILKIQKWQTANNINVLFHQAKELPIIDIAVTFQAGFAYSGNHPGLAYFTNNMLLEGTKSYSAEQLAIEIANIGALSNLETTADYSYIHFRIINNQDSITKTIYLLKEILAHAKFNKNNFLKTKTEIINQINNQNQLPNYIALNNFYKTIYQNHPYWQPVNGTVDSIKNITLEQVIDFYNKYYVANNAKIAIVANFNKQQAENLAKKIAANLRVGKTAPPLPNIDIANLKTHDIKIPFPTTQNNIIIGLPTIKWPATDDIHAFFTANNILGGTAFISELFDQIREQNGYAYSVYSTFVPRQLPGPFYAFMQTKNSKSPAAKQLAMKIITDFVKHGPTAEQLKTAKLNITGKTALKIASNEDKLHFLMVIGFYNLSTDYLNNYNNKINALTLNDLNNSIKKYLKLNKLNIINVGPVAKQS